jgi:hypothetical protein
VVTIYILIPFIVIPQLMLSGVLLRFEKINPTISEPASVPWYGEIITARWAFEALAVEQFINNKYEQPFYLSEKTMSIAEFRKNYWLVEMKNKLAEVKTAYERNDEINAETLALLANEIATENEQHSQIQLDFRKQAEKELSTELITQTSEYFDQLNRYYTALYSKASEIKNRQLDGLSGDSLLVLKSQYFNQSLADLVKNSNEIYRLVEYKGRLLQNYHPIYKDPEHPFIKAQFYAPVKNVFGAPVPTVWVNIVIIWCFNLFFYLVLYFRWLPGLMKLFQRGKTEDK